MLGGGEERGVEHLLWSLHVVIPGWYETGWYNIANYIICNYSTHHARYCTMGAACWGKVPVGGEQGKFIRKMGFLSL